MKASAKQHVVHVLCGARLKTQAPGERTCNMRALPELGCLQRARPTSARLPAMRQSFRLLETNCASGFEQPCARVDSQGASTHRSPHAWLPATHTPTDRAHGRERAHHGGEVRYRIFSFFCMYVHALTCRHPCQRGGARGSHARVDLGDLLTARMSGAGCAGRSIIQQPPLSLRPSPLPEQSCSRSRRGRTCRLSLLGRACSISWRALSGVLSHISAQDHPVRDSI